MMRFLRLVNYLKFNAFEILFLLLANYAYKKIKLIEIFLKKEHENKKRSLKLFLYFLNLYGISFYIEVKHKLNLPRDM